MDKRSESQFDYREKENSGYDFRAMPSKYSAPGSETREELFPANVPLKHLINHGDNPVSGDDIAISRGIRKANKEKKQSQEKIRGKVISNVGFNKGKASDVASLARRIKETTV